METFTFTDYQKPYGYDTFLKNTEQFCVHFPRKIFAKKAGKTAKGRSIVLIKAGEGKKRLLCIGAIHGREYVSSAFIMRSLYELLSENTLILQDASLYLCPMVNPDGVEIALGNDTPLVQDKDFCHELYKNNAHNINLNANFPYYFSFVPFSRQGGSSAGSEKETQTLMNICKRYNFLAALSFHCRGNCIYWQDKCNGTVEGDRELASALQKKCGYSLVPPTQKVEDYSGGFENWFRHRFRRPALCVELVADETLPFYKHCTDFDNAVNWQYTRHTLKTFIDTCAKF